MLFSDKKNFYCLFITQSAVHIMMRPDKLEIVTGNAIYMGMKNDLAFIVDTDLFLYEHQSLESKYACVIYSIFPVNTRKLVDHKSLFFCITENTGTSIYCILQMV